MLLHILGVSHRVASAAEREAWALHPSEWPAFYDKLRPLQKAGTFSEALFLSTCNRAEWYLVTSDEGKVLSEREMAEWFFKSHPRGDDLTSGDVQGGAPYFYQGREAIQHLLRVTCGLDSLILGEQDITHQVKQAFQYATGQGMVGSFLNRLFEQALRAAKRVRFETAIGARSVSVASVAVRLMLKMTSQIFEERSNQRVLVLGSGRVGKQVMDHVLSAGPWQGIEWVGRRVEKVEALIAAQGRPCSIRPFGLNEWIRVSSEVLVHADIVFSALALTEPLECFSVQCMRQVIRHRRYKPLLIFDLGLPRNVPLAVKTLEDVFYVDMDTLAESVEHNRQLRALSVQQAHLILNDHSQDFWAWYQERQARGLIRQYRREAEHMRLRSIQQAQAALRRGDSVEGVLNQLADTLTKRLIHPAYVALKKAARCSELSSESVLMWLESLMDKA